ncbi:hemolysin family calcium-binding region [Firmicutes bacterium CAG:313]|nr:hemolysin family calcium-binding region [Firmicutes bacterium CAG:313]
MKKKIYFIISILLMTIMLSSLKIKANSLANLYVVFNKLSFKNDEIVDITINLDQFIDLNEIKLQIKIKNEYFEPILEDNKPFYFDSASIFKTDIINDYIDNSYLRLRLIKDSVIDSGYYSNYKNNVCHFRLKTKRPINDIKEYFTLDNYEEMGLSVYLFNTNDKIINYKISYNQKIQITWDKEKYIVEVFSDVPNFKEDIVIANRESNQYEFLLEKQINTDLIGLKTIHVGVYDKLTADYIILSKPVEVVDTTKPTITYPNIIEINDDELLEIDLLHYIECNDNYDEYLKIQFQYFSYEGVEINNLELFTNYLSNHYQGYLIVKCEDTSGNVAITPNILIRVKDTKPPKITKLDEIRINDIDIETIDLEKYFQITDQYDNNPRVILKFFDTELNDESSLKKRLSKGEKIKFEYMAIDESGNSTERFNCLIIPVDTIAPNIEVVDLEILDTDYNYSVIEKSLKVVDNFIYQCNLNKNYYICEEEVDYDTFNNMVQRGYLGKIRYQANDLAGNTSGYYYQSIKLIDTTQPIIEVENINESQKYTNIEKINYHISDNFDNVEFEVWLDDLVYEESQLVNLEKGLHKFKIIAKDTSNNVSQAEITFEIIEDNLIGCGNDPRCYLNNYLEVVIMVVALIVFVAIIIVIKIIMYNKKKTKTK